MSELYQWRDPSGGIHALSGGVDGVQVLRSVTGHLAPPIRRTDDVVPGQPGVRKRAVLHDASEVALLVALRSSTETGLRALIRTWIARFNPTLGDGTLLYTGPDGATRQRTCGYTGGLEGDESDNSRFSGQQNAIVTFKAADPYWADTVDSSQLWTAGAARLFFPIFPLVLGASQILGAANVTNGGDVDTFPVWIISGPTTGFTLTNALSGRTLAWSGTLGLGEQVAIDCRGGNQTSVPKSVLRGDGANVFSLLTAADFWPLTPGVQSIVVEMVGAGVGSQVAATWRNRYTSS